MPRTNMDIEPETHRQLRVIAALEDKTMKAVIAELVAAKAEEMGVCAFGHRHEPNATTTEALLRNASACDHRWSDVLHPECTDASKPQNRLQQCAVCGSRHIVNTTGETSPAEMAWLCGGGQKEDGKAYENAMRDGLKREDV